ncbi:MAG: hypothetical protein KIT56_07835 [Gammaproteobacteria bacterium]|nr:hypothetical protein [Gammaproteobacteria bacterium]MCW5583770.1 hypothetical protein [Gammaproteobacteria bacterium]
MKKFICFITLFFASTSFAEQLHNFKQIESAVSEGKLIRILVNYEKCTPLSTQKMVGNHYAVFTPNAMAIGNDGNIGTYVLYFTLQDPHYPSKAVYQHGNYIISKDNSITITFTTLNAADYTQMGTSITINCKIDDSAKVFVNQQDQLMKSDPTKSVELQTSYTFNKG